MIEKNPEHEARTPMEQGEDEALYCVQVAGEYLDHIATFKTDETDYVGELAALLIEQRAEAALKSICRTEQDSQVKGTDAHELEQRHCKQAALKFVNEQLPMRRDKTSAIADLIFKERNQACQRVLDESHVQLADALATIEGITDKSLLECIGCARKVSRAQMQDHVLTCTNHPFHTIMQTLRDGLFHAIDRLGGDTMMGSEWSNEKLIAVMNETVDMTLENDSEAGKRFNALRDRNIEMENHAIAQDHLLTEVGQTLRVWASQLRAESATTGEFVAQELERRFATWIAP